MKRIDIVNEAKSWVGTKWQHQQALKGVVCDCAGLVRGVYYEIKHEPVEVMDYPATWHLFKDEPRMLETCRKYLDEIDITDVREGDVLLFGYRRRFVAHHMAIVIQGQRMIHADQDAKMVLISPLDDTWKSRIRHAFRFKDLED